MKAATPAQKKRLIEIESGNLTRTGGRIRYWYFMRNSNAITVPMVGTLETNGWIDWDCNVAVLTWAGRQQIGGAE
jgi:hypothetical protein